VRTFFQSPSFADAASPGVIVSPARGSSGGGGGGPSSMD
jgi:hypothetical protein